MASYVSVKDKNGRYKSYKVNENVAIYVKQLEAAINYPGESRLREAYPERFSGKAQQLSNISEEEMRKRFPNAMIAFREFFDNLSDVARGYGHTAVWIYEFFLRCGIEIPWAECHPGNPEFFQAWEKIEQEKNNG